MSILKKLAHKYLVPLHLILILATISPAQAGNLLLLEKPATTNDLVYQYIHLKLAKEAPAKKGKFTSTSPTPTNPPAEEPETQYLQSNEAVEYTVSTETGKQDPDKPDDSKPFLKDPPQQLVEEMKNTLDGLEQLLKEQTDKKKLVIVSDLDDSLLFNPDALDKELIPDPDTAFSIQQTWFTQLEQFYTRNSDRTFLVYNTSRSIPPKENPFLKSDKDYLYSVSLNDVKRVNSHPMVRFVQKHARDEHFGLPNPGLLICNHGSYLQAVEPPSIEPSFLDSTNRLLYEWYLSDLQNLRLLATQTALHTQLIAKTTSGENFYYFKVGETLPAFQPEPFSLYNHRHIAVTPVVRNGMLNTVYLQDVTLNKGTALRIGIQWLVETGKLIPGKFLVVIIGDSHLDLSMLRPEHEIEAVAPVSPADIFLRESRVLRVNGLAYTRDIVSSHWVLSINPDPSSMPTDENPLIQSMIRHPKFVTISSAKGALGVMNQILETLTQYFQEK